MNTLNYWLGKLNKLQLFGHGVKQIYVANETTETFYVIQDVKEIDGTVYITVKE